MREYLLAMLELPECDLQLIEEMVNIDMDELLTPYVLDDLFIRFTDRLYNIMPELLEAATVFSETLSFARITADALDSLFTNLFGNNTVGNMVSNFLNNILTTRNHYEEMGIGINNYIENLNRLIRMYPNNGAVTPFELLRLYQYSGNIFAQTHTFHSHVQQIIDLLICTQRYALDIYNIVAGVEGDLFNSTGVRSNYATIYNQISILLWTHYRVETSYLAIFDLAMAFQYLIGNFFRTRYNLD